MIFLLCTLVYITEFEYERIITQSIANTVCGAHERQLLIQFNHYFRRESFWKKKLIWIIPAGVAILLMIIIPNVIISLKHTKKKNTANAPTKGIFL